MVTTSRLVALLSFGIALIGALPLMPWLENLPRLLFVIGLLVGLLQEARGRWQLKDWQLNLALVPVFLWYLLQYSRSNPIQPVVSLLLIMLAARLCAEKSIRNLMQINLLALFCLASRSLFDLSPSFLLWLGLLLLLIPLSLVVLTFHSQDRTMRFTRMQLRRVLLAALAMVMITLPALVLLFPILPRTAFPLWHFLAPTIGVTGISDKVEVGATASVAESRALAFRAEMPRQSQPPYWRGTVFNRLQENNWSRNPAVPPETILHSGQRVVQTIYPEPSSSRLLVGLDTPVELSLPWVRITPDRVVESQRGLSRRIGYTVSSDTGGLLRTARAVNRGFYLTLPATTSQEIRQLAKRIAQAGRTDAERLELVEQHFLNGGYRYSRVGLPVGKDAIHQFLFVSKQGHCEFFASSMAMLLRAAGVPARLVGGYLGGEYNETGGYYLVSQDSAHVWVEAYISGKGWLRTDPSRFASNADAVWNEKKKRSLAMRLSMLVDALDYRWNRAVVTYDFERQTGQLRRAGARLQSLEQVFKAHWPLVMTVIAVVAGLIAALKFKLFRRGKSREERLIRRFLQVVQKRYGAAYPLENRGLFEVAAEIGDQNLRQFVAIYGAAIYQDRRLTPHEVKQLEKLIAQLSVPEARK